MTSVRLLSVALLASLGFVVGCGGGSKTPGNVTGTVRYKDQLVKAGTVHFHTETGTAFPGPIGPDGSYTAPDLPTGEMVVTVETESMNPKKDEPQSKDAARRMAAMQQPAAGSSTGGDLYVKIPAKYADPKKSPLKKTIGRGKQTHNIELTD